MGQSLGTGVTIDFVHRNREWTTPIILVSPYKTIVSVVSDTSLRSVYDKFETINKINNIKCPVKIFHGDNDNVINISHGKQIYEELNQKVFEPTWLAGIGHNDILNAINVEDLMFVINYES